MISKLLNAVNRFTSREFETELTRDQRDLLREKFASIIDEYQEESSSDDGDSFINDEASEASSDEEESDSEEESDGEEESDEDDGEEESDGEEARVTRVVILDDSFDAESPDEYEEEEEENTSTRRVRRRLNRPVIIDDDDE